MRADRLLSMIWLLRVHNNLSAAELAERLEVSRRTILRDVEALSSAGVPVYCERGPHGGVRLLPGYRTEVTGLSSEESRALFAGVTTWGAESLGLGDALASGLRKLLAAVPEDHRGESVDMSARIVVDPQGWLPQPESERTGATFQVVQAAVFEQKRLRMIYRHKNRSSVKVSEVNPVGLVNAGRSWYLCFSALDSDDLRFARLSRVQSAEKLVEPCTYGHKVDVARAWKIHREKFVEKLVAVTVTAWVREGRWNDVCEWAISVREGEPTGDPPQGDEWLFVELEFVDHLHAETILLRLGSDARVETPVKVRDSLIDHLTDTLRNYRSGAPDDVLP